MGDDRLITLRGFLQVLEASKPVTINLYDKDTELLIITFLHPGYAALEDEIELAEISKIVVKNLYTFDVYINRTI